MAGQPSLVTAAARLSFSRNDCCPLSSALPHAILPLTIPAVDHAMDIIKNGAYRRDIEIIELAFVINPRRFPMNASVYTRALNKPPKLIGCREGLRVKQNAPLSCTVVARRIPNFIRHALPRGD